MLAPQVEGRSVVTIEGLADGPALDVLQQKFIESGAVQCGYRTPGLILAARALLLRTTNPSREELLVALEETFAGAPATTRSCRPSRRPPQR